jgi:hypothetical protein
MKWHKSPDAVVQAFDHCLPVVAGVERKAMFGHPCAVVNGHLFCGLHQDGIIVHLPEARRAALVAEGARLFEPVPGEEMKEFVILPIEIVQDRGRLRALLGEALAHASSLAPKSKRASAVKKKVTTPKRPSVAAGKTGMVKKAPAKKKVPARKAPAKKPAKKKAPADGTPTKRKAPLKRAPARKSVTKSVAKRGAAHRASPERKRSR